MWEELKKHFVTYALTLILGAVVYSSITSFRAESGLTDLKKDLVRIESDFAKSTSEFKQNTNDTHKSFQVNVDTKLSNIEDSLTKTRKDFKESLDSHKKMIEGLRSGLAKVAKKTDALDDDVLKELIIIGSNVEKLGDDNLLKEISRQESKIARLEHDLYRIKEGINNYTASHTTASLPRRTELIEKVLQKFYQNEGQLDFIALSKNIPACSKDTYSHECIGRLGEEGRHLREAKERMEIIFERIKNHGVERMSPDELESVLEELSRVERIIEWHTYRQK